MRRFRDIASFLLTRATPPIFHLNFEGVPLGLDVDVDVVSPRSENRKLMIRVINFELVQPTCPRYLDVTDGQTHDLR